MAATFNYYDSYKVKLMQGKFDFSTHTFRAILCTSSYTPSASTHDELADITDQLATGNGYVAGGVVLASGALTIAAGVVKFDADDVFWSAVGGSIGPARYLILFDDTPTGDPLIAFIDFGEDKTAGVGTDFKVNWAVGGIATIG